MGVVTLYTQTLIMKSISLTLTFFTLLSLSHAVAQKNQKLTDPEIAAIAVTANQVDVQAAEQAEKKTHNEAVRNFAHTMIQDHRSVIDKATALCGKLHVTPKPGATSKQLSSNGAKMRKQLQGKSGASFDKAYIDNEVTYHQAVIATVTDTLIPETQNPELKALLESVVPVLRTHLEHAQMVQHQLAAK